jgi:hypothetical protein
MDWVPMKLEMGPGEMWWSCPLGATRARASSISASAGSARRHRTGPRLAFPYFAGLNKTIDASIRDVIRKGVQGRTAKEVRWATLALMEWKTLASAKKVSEPPDSLISKIIYLIEAGRTVGLSSLIWTAGEMFKKGWLSSAEVNSLADSLPDVFKDADYREIRPNGPEGVTASLIRETCIKIGKRLYENEPRPALKDMIETAKGDALPEVRFAAEAPLAPQKLATV